AQVWSSHQPDPDSTPCNNSTDEDDDDTAVVVPGDTPTPEPTPLADLSLIKPGSYSSTEEQPGVNTITYAITVTNHGPDNATGVTVIDTLPASFTYVISQSSSGSYTPATGVWTIGDLITNTTATLLITGTVMDTGVFTNFAQVAA